MPLGRGRQERKDEDNRQKGAEREGRRKRARGKGKKEGNAVEGIDYKKFKSADRVAVPR